MLDLIREAISNLQNETLAYSQGVQLWMKVMGFSFLFSVVFIHKKAAARWILAALILNILGLITGKILFPNESRTIIGTYVHLIFWPAILWAVWRTSRTQSMATSFKNLFDGMHRVWLIWASCLMVISLFFDMRTLVLTVV
jgi:hypothetical protein